MKGLRQVKPLPAASLRGVEPAKVGAKLPKIEWVSPGWLYVEEDYQREVGAGGTRLIRGIVARFSWARFKPPVCARREESGSALVVIDGQHTAIAAATLGIEHIPVLVIPPTEDVGERALAFVGHNLDRRGLTQMAIYRAELAAGDELAKVIDKACRAAGAEILQDSVSLNRPIEPGKTIAVGTIRALARSQGESFLARVLRLLTKAGRGPIKANEIAAVAVILECSGHEDAIDDRLRAVVASKAAEEWQAIGAIGDPAASRPASLVSVWCRELGLRVGAALPKGGNNAKRMVKVSRATPGKPEAAAPPPPTPRQTPNPKLIPAPTPPRPAPPPLLPRSIEVSGVAGRVAEFNGVKIDMAARVILHRGRQTMRVPDDGVKLVAALARVMPSLLDADRLAKTVWGNSKDAGSRVRALAERMNPDLAGARLAIRHHKLGHMLADLGE